MPKVVVLPDHVASQIAAGEVVDRPAAVVKELIENAIDAGASQIEIAIAADCRDIRVADDGHGMDAEDAVLAFQRHATSKLASAEDLSNLHTLGFRGEALPSIASVAKVTCFTRTMEANNGVRLDAADGKLTTREAGCAPGTAIEVSDLFYNVPARLSFLKKPSTEFGHIHEIVQSLAVAYPKIMFQLLNHGEVVLRTTGSGKLAQAMQEVGIFSGKEELFSVTYADMKYGMAVYGYIARPPISRGDRKGIVTIVNNRPVRCSLTYKALDQVYSDLIPKGKHPLAVVTVTIDPSQIDVNVHPTKKEVKYSNGSDVYLAIQHALKETLRAQERAAFQEGSEPAVARVAEPVTGESDAWRQAESIREAVLSQPVMASSPRSTYQRLQQISFRDRLAYAPTTAPRLPSNIADPILTSHPKAPATLPPGWRIAGYLHNTYVLIQTSEGLQIVEQHIAHERVIYERILAQQKTPGRLTENSQRLVISAPLNLTPVQRGAIESNQEFLRSLGFDFEFVGDAVSCTQVPLEMATKDYASSVQEMVEHLLEVESADFHLEATKSVACQAAIKNGMPLSEAELIELLSEWNSCPRNDTCPHGRPICLRFSKDQLFQMFHPD